jgi:hypothetical protein
VAEKGGNIMTKSESKNKMAELISELILLIPDTVSNRSRNDDWWMSGDNHVLELEKGIVINFRNDNRIEILVSKDEDILSLYSQSLSQMNANMFKL